MTFLSILAAREAKHCWASSLILEAFFLTSSTLMVSAFLYVFCLVIGPKSLSVSEISAQELFYIIGAVLLVALSAKNCIMWVRHFKIDR